MVLSQPELRRAVRKKEIIFDPPLEENQWGEASVDLRLGFSFTKLKPLKGVTISVAQGLGAIGQLGFWETVEKRETDIFGKRESFVLGPGEFVLAFTRERIVVPRHLIGLVEGRSTYARVGLSMHQTAPWIQPGWDGPIVLEMMNNGPLQIELTPVIDRPCQISFLKLSSPLPKELTYGARASDIYQHQQHPLKHKPPRKK
ncbi:MAG TPA: dCTP deaminase [Candidatus Binataceae bacterium]|nr:dCTP deaminase [Candidatus Binataceae bacterium]